MSRSSFSAFVLLVLALFLVLSLELSRHARMIPLFAAAMGMTLAALRVFMDWYRIHNVGGDNIPSLISAELGHMAWLLGLPVLVGLFGFVVGIPVYLLGYLRYRAAVTWVAALVIAFISMAVIYLIFDRLMRMPLYGGVL